MKLTAFALLLSAVAFAQVSFPNPTRSGTALPATCTPGSLVPDFFNLVVGSGAGATAQNYQCTAPDTWTAVPTGGNVINAASYGCDGTPTNDDTCTARIRAVCATSPSIPVVVNFPPTNPPTTWQITNSYMFEGCLDATVNLNGGNLQNVTDSGTCDSYYWLCFAIQPKCGDFFRGEGSLTTSPPCSTINDVTTYPIETVGNGSQSVTTVTAGDAANFSVGNNVLIYGYNQQDGGYPPNVRYFDYAVVTAVDSGTGIITLQGPISNSYDSLWPNDSDVETNPGAPVIINLNRSDFQVSTNFHLNCGGGALLASPGASFLNYNGFGGTEFGGILNVTVENCTVGVLSFTEVNSFQQINTIAYQTSPDKVINSYTVVGGFVGNINDAADVNSVSIARSILYNANAAGARSYVIDNSILQSSSGAYGVVACSQGTPQKLCGVSNSTVVFQGAADTAFALLTNQALSLTFGTVSCTGGYPLLCQTTVPFDWGIVGSADYGQSLVQYNGGGSVVGWCVITAIYDADGTETNLNIDATCQGANPPSGTFYYATTQDVGWSGNTLNNANYPANYQQWQPIAGNGLFDPLAAASIMNGQTMVEHLPPGYTAAQQISGPFDYNNGQPTGGFLMTTTGFQGITPPLYSCAAASISVPQDTLICTYFKTGNLLSASGVVSFVPSGGSALDPSGGGCGASILDGYKAAITSGELVSGTTGTCTITVTMGKNAGGTIVSSNSGWFCKAQDQNTGVWFTQSANTTTTCTLSGVTTSGDVILFDAGIGF